MFSSTATIAARTMPSPRAHAVTTGRTLVPPGKSCRKGGDLFPSEFQSSADDQGDRDRPRIHDEHVLETQGPQAAQAPDAHRPLGRSWLYSEGSRHRHAYRYSIPRICSRASLHLPSRTTGSLRGGTAAG